MQRRPVFIGAALLLEIRQYGQSHSTTPPDIAVFNSVTVPRRELSSAHNHASRDSGGISVARSNAAGFVIRVRTAR